MKTYLRTALGIGLVLSLEIGLPAAEPPLEAVVAVRSKSAHGWDGGTVRVRGTITFASPQMGMAFLQDDTAGVAFYPRGFKQSGPLKSGEMVELTGIPMVHEGTLMLCGVGSTREVPLPPAVTWLTEGLKETVKTRAFDLSSASEMRVTAELIQTTGVVRRVSRQPNVGMTVEVSSPVGYAVARLPWIVEDEVIHQWLNQEVEFEGVVLCRADKRLLPVDADAVVFVPTGTHWRPQPGVMNAVFATPAVTAAQISRTGPVSRSTGRLHVVGHITAIRPPSTIDLRTDDGSVEISTRQAHQFYVGEKISVACWLLNKQGRVVLADGVCRSHGGADPVVPVAVSSAAAAAKAGQGELVRFTGRVRDVYRERTQGRLLVALDEGGTCAVRWEPPVTVAALAGNGIGATFELTGICESANAVNEGANFTLRPRSNADFRLLSSAPWWTRQRLSRALWTLLILVGIAVPGAIFLRWKIWKQEQRIRQIERAAASAQERQRIAREFHDNLQQELFSTSLHVETLREACESAPAMLPALLDEISSMLRHCQVEARNCIWDLRADDEFREGLTPSLRSWLSMRQRLVPGTSLEFQTEGEETRLPANTCLQVLRISQEAVNNAIAHARAAHVVVRMKHMPQSLEVLVEDDGKGFNTVGTPAAADGHYGLSMLQERAQHIHARVDLRSEKDRGTFVRLIVPLTSRQS